VETDRAVSGGVDLVHETGWTKIERVRSLVMREQKRLCPRCARTQRVHLLMLSPLMKDFEEQILLVAVAGVLPPSPS
jgi:hypothetical protein